MFIAQRVAMQVQQAQFALDQQKKDVQAQFAAFQGINGGGAAPGGAPSPGMTAPGAPPPGPMAQPMAPGQASVPNLPTGGAPPVPGAMPPGGAPGASMAPPAPVSPPGATSAPAPSQGVGAAPPGQIDPTDPMAGTKVVMQIAQEIKGRESRYRPADALLMATQHIIDVSKGMAPQLRQAKPKHGHPVGQSGAQGETWGPIRRHQEPARRTSRMTRSSILVIRAMRQRTV